MNTELQQLARTLLPDETVRELLTRCVDEDGGRDGDITSKSIVSEGTQGRFAINLRGSGVISGLEPLSRAIEVFGEISMTVERNDGDYAEAETIAYVDGTVQSVLLAERAILNILGHACGIATTTRKFVDAIAGCDCVVCDTRKTTPGLRMLDKYAVACGGGTLHRLGLQDAALYKDNHLASLVDGIEKLQEAIKSVRTDHELQFVEVEVDSLQQLEEILLLDVDMVLLDNFSIEQLNKAVELRNNADRNPLLEASGGVTVETVRNIAQSGIDRIAVGAITHQSTWIDIGLDAIDA